MPGKRKRSMVDQADVPEEDILFGGQDILYLRDDDEDFKKIINDHLDGLRHEAEDPTFEIDEEDILPEETLAVSDDKELPEHGTHVTEISNDETEEDILFAGQDILYFRDDDEDFKKIFNNHLDRLRHEAEDPSFEIDEEDILPEETLAVGDDEVLPEHETRVTEISDNEAEFIACGEKGTPLWDADEEAKVQVNRYAYFNRLLPPNEEFAEEAKGVEKPTFDVQSLG